METFLVYNLLFIWCYCFQVKVDESKTIYFICKFFQQCMDAFFICWAAELDRECRWYSYLSLDGDVSMIVRAPCLLPAWFTSVSECWLCTSAFVLSIAKYQVTVSSSLNMCLPFTHNDLWFLCKILSRLYGQAIKMSFFLSLKRPKCSWEWDTYNLYVQHYTTWCLLPLWKSI